MQGSYLILKFHIIRLLFFALYSAKNLRDIQPLLCTSQQHPWQCCNWHRINLRSAHPASASPDHGSPAMIPEPEPEPEEPLADHPECSPGERDARESTELARLRRIYSRTSSHQRPGSSTASTKPTGLLARFIYVVKKFWKHQISITVAHKACRDHLGTDTKIFLVKCLQIKSAL